jgi:RNA polymerase sigma-70 factor (ECF subfamily)
LEPAVPTKHEHEFLALVRANEGRLRHICRVYARDVEARKDLYQEIMFQLWRSLPSFAGASTIDTWVYRVALNTALTHARRRSAHVETPLDDDDGDGALAASSPEAADDTPDLREQSDRLYAAIDRLNAVDRMLVTMYLDDRSYREMAEVIGITESNVGVKLHRVKKMLARSLTEETV